MKMTPCCLHKGFAPYLIEFFSSVGDVDLFLKVGS